MPTPASTADAVRRTALSEDRQIWHDAPTFWGRKGFTDMPSITSSARRARRLPSALGASLLAIAAAGLATPALAQDTAPAAAPATATTTGIPAWNLKSA